MVRRSRSDLDDVFTALADPTRRAILARLTEGDAYVSELGASHDMSLAAVSRHLHVLAEAGLMTRSKEGRKIRCSLNADGLDQAYGWMTHYRGLWHQKLTSLGAFLEGGQ